uniref:RING-type domain-containing protein n=1 Tax=Manihot esculenta TaxID=3983 RepID=A0A251L339_MANES
MASEKPKQGGKSPMSSSFPQSNEELAPFHLQDGADNLAGIIDNMVQSATFFLAGDVHGMPQSHAQEMSFPVMKDDLAWNVNVNDFGQYHTLGDSVAAAANIHTTGLGNSQIERNNVTNGADVSSGLQMLKAGGEANDNEICRPWLIENQINHAGTMSLSGYIPSAGEFGMNISQMCTAGGEANGNNIPVPWVFGNQFIHAGVAQSNNPEMLDGNFLTLGYESNVETGSKYNVSSEDNSQGTKQIVLSMLNTYSSQNFARNSLNSSSKLADDSSSFCKYDSGFIRRALNESDCKRIGHVQNDDGFSSLGQNANGMSHQVCNANVFSSPVQNVVASYHQAENKDRSSSQTQNVGWLSKPSGDGRVGTQLPLVDKQHHNHTPTSWNSGLGEKKKATFANTNPHTSFQGLRTKSLMPPNSNQVFLPDTGWFGVTESSPPSSWVRSTIQPASDQLRSPHVGSVRNFSSNPSVVLPFNGVTRSIGLQGQSGKHRTPQPSGRQCHICKRDLSFTPEGPIYQPEKPITAAVLPCGHHFHDSCLQRITPLNQAHDPPCIPCAIGD